MLCEVKPVADNKIIGNFKAAIINLDINFAAARFVEKSADFYTVRLFVKEIFDKKIHRRAGVDNIFHKQNISAFGIVVEIFENIDFAAGLRIGVVAGGDKKIELDGNSQPPHNVVNNGLEISL